MASLFRKTVTRRLPPRAELFNRGHRQFARWKDRGGRVLTAEVVKGADGCLRVRTKSTTVYAKLRIGGEVREIPTGCRSEDAARHALAELVRRAEHIRAGILTNAETRTADHQASPLAEHFDAYAAHLDAKGCTAAHRDAVRARLDRLATSVVAHSTCTDSGTRSTRSWRRRGCRCGRGRC